MSNLGDQLRAIATQVDALQGGSQPPNPLSPPNPSPEPQPQPTPQPTLPAQPMCEFFVVGESDGVPRSARYDNERQGYIVRQDVAMVYAFAPTQPCSITFAVVEWGGGATGETEFAISTAPADFRQTLPTYGQCPTGAYVMYDVSAAEVGSRLYFNLRLRGRGNQEDGSYRCFLELSVR